MAGGVWGDGNWAARLSGSNAHLHELDICCSLFLINIIQAVLGTELLSALFIEFLLASWCCWIGNCPLPEKLLSYFIPSELHTFDEASQEGICIFAAACSTPPTQIVRFSYLVSLTVTKSVGASKCFQDICIVTSFSFELSFWLWR